jgi:hypothetical protein
MHKCNKCVKRVCMCVRVCVHAQELEAHELVQRIDLLYRVTQRVLYLRSICVCE